MAQIYVCFLWHMHQPFYKDLVSGEYKLPWTRMHALKDYYGMVKILEDFPSVHQTFNIVPSLMVQIEEYASGQASDGFLRAALKPAEQLCDQEKAFILQYFFQANVGRMIYRYPRYAELWEAWRAAGQNYQRAQRTFGTQAYRDLQVLSQLAWFDEEWLTHDRDVRELARKQRNYSLDDQALLGRKQIEVIGKVLPIYREFAARGQIELSTTPFYHPILPLLCDSNIASVAHPFVPLPTRFQYPGDAKQQVDRARDYVAEKTKTTPVGMWPSEGSVSDEVLHLACSSGFRWIGTDNGVLSRTLHQTANASITYRPYLWRQGNDSIHVLFRDHYLSDLIGFVYSRMGAVEAANHFLDRVRENCRSILLSGRDALVPVILDGENAWEYYEESGRPFLRELYRRIADDPRLTALTISEALQKVQSEELDHIFPGSWINANFDVWIGAEEDNKAWEYLLRARRAYDRFLEAPNPAVSESRRKIAHEELMIAEGSDWCWWYGPEHDSANRPEFDQLFRDHLANVYVALNLQPPEELSRPILKVAVTEFHQAPTGPVRATIDGEVSSYFEWLGAGLYKVDRRSGSLHGGRYFVEQVQYGSDGQNLFLRLDFAENVAAELDGAEVRLNVQSAADPKATESFTLSLATSRDGVEAAYRRIFELRIPLTAVHVQVGQAVRFQLSVWQSGLPMDALPPQGWIEFSTGDPLVWVL
jgi:alpha-amylase/alpha-mannosidase (GH57 family)